MRTTLNIDDDLYRDIKVEAARRGSSITSVIEDALRASLRSADIARPDFPVSSRSSGVRAGVDLDDPNQWFELLYGDDDRRADVGSRR
ncbi:MAG: CopG family transcriptional regulator [Actinomycetes bacterium]